MDKGRGRPQKSWMDCMKDKMSNNEVDTEMTDDRVERRKYIVSTT